MVGLLIEIELWHFYANTDSKERGAFQPAIAKARWQSAGYMQMMIIQNYENLEFTDKPI